MDGVEADVTFATAGDDTQAAIDAAYHAKYDSYGPRIVGSVTGPDTHDVTVRLVPASSHNVRAAGRVRGRVRGRSGSDVPSDGAS